MFGARLKKARHLAGVTPTELAEWFREDGYDITPAEICRYEREESFPDAEYLLTACYVLEVPSTYFAYEPAMPVEWMEFRSRDKLSKQAKNQIKAYASDVAELQIELRDLLYPTSNFPLPSIAVKSLEDAESAAEQLRETWNVGARPLDNLVQIAEDRDIVVIAWEDKTGGFDGLAGLCGGRPVAVINAKVPTDRQRFSLAHEIGHLVMTIAEPADGADEEALANRFAAALIVPAGHARHELGCQRNCINWGELKSLKRKYGLSMSAWLHRADELEIITADTYRLMRDDLESRGWYEKEPVEYRSDEEPLLLKQMCERALSQGLISIDRITCIDLDILDEEPSEERQSEYPDAMELLEMDEAERDAWMEKFAEMAEELEFEEFLPMDPPVDYDSDFAWQ